MQIVNKRSYALEIAATFQVVEPGQTVEVPDDLGESLLEQPDNWESVKGSRPKKADATSDEAASSGEEV